MCLIAILTDFGTKDEYVAAMKGVISSISPKAKTIDISHQIQKHNVKQGSYMLKRLIGYFPKGTIYLGVVDPGVGTERKGLLIEAKGAWFIGPDNGLLIPAAQKLGIKRVIKLTNRRYWLKPTSSTFHGRDIFAPVAAWLSKGTEPTNFGKVIENWVNLENVQPKVKGDTIFGEVLHVDDFGNIITNIPTDLMKVDNEVWISIKDALFSTKIRKSYGEIKRGELLVLIGSSGFLEIAKNQENAAKYFKVKEGAEIRVRHS